MKNDGITRAWREYEKGVEFKNTISLYSTVDENIRFYEGDQWKGLATPNIPTPVFNILRAIGRFMTVQVKDKKLTLKYTTDCVADPDYYPDSEDAAEAVEAQRILQEQDDSQPQPANPGAEQPIPKNDLQIMLDQMTKYSRETWSRLNMEYKNLEGLKDAFCTGDYILYHWWNDTIETGQPFTGDIDNMILDNVNYYPANPNSNDVQSQPYIILVFRQMVEDVKRIAKKNKMPEKEIEKIRADTDNTYTSGEYGKIELAESGKCNVLLKMWKEDGKVCFAKYTKYVEIQKKTDSKLKLYPVVMMNWDTRKNCCHGISEITHLKSNQVYINKQMAFSQLYLLACAYPKVIYDKTALPDGWTNKVASAVAANGSVKEVAAYMQPPQIPFDVWKGVETTLQNTMDLAGVNDAAMGNISNPDNRSAFVAVREAAIVPLEAQQQRFWQMMRDMGRVWLDFWMSHYPPERRIVINENGTRLPVTFNLAEYRTLVFDAQVEVGESNMWSEVSTVNTLDNLLARNIITPAQYFKRVPDGYIPDKDELYQEALKQEQQQQMMQEMQMNQMNGGAQQQEPEEPEGQEGQPDMAQLLAQMQQGQQTPQGQQMPQQLPPQGV